MVQLLKIKPEKKLKKIKTLLGLCGVEGWGEEYFFILDQVNLVANLIRSSRCYELRQSASGHQNGGHDTVQLQAAPPTTIDDNCLGKFHNLFPILEWVSVYFINLYFL